MNAAVRCRLVFRILAASLEERLYTCIRGWKVEIRRLSGLQARLSRLDGGAQCAKFLFPPDDGQGGPLQPRARGWSGPPWPSSGGKRNFAH